MVDQPGVCLKDLSFRIGDFSMRDLSLKVRCGEYYVLTGPNGAGKTILVKLIAGLLRPDRGEVWIQGRPVTDLPPWKRNIGYVPQDGLLFPNYTVARNIDFGLRMRHAKAKHRKQEVARIADILEITHLLDRRIEGLSGGEQQKVALARALILNPTLLLLDEPVSAIHEESRDPLCKQLKRIHTQLKITTLHVSHNRDETSLLADRVGIMMNGTLREGGAPHKE